MTDRSVVSKPERRLRIMGYRILVVEDSAVIRRLIEVCLRAGDVEVITREDGPGGSKP